MKEDEALIREAQSQDFPAVYDFINALENIVFDKDKQRLLFESNIQDKDYCYRVALLNDKVAGYISCHTQMLLHHGGRIGEIQELFVAADKRNYGIGKLLVNAVKLWAQQNEVLQLEVAANNDRLQTHQFYTREGFVHTHKKFVYGIF
ncbi:GNAT family N-acetyltransferase [Ohtaekwangia kribbensis]|jgi:PhnO protein|uniref:GNAT family N-acetyltransferase n=1 Tax=Ohtaekwangia kribbensis TaxID=688913 RepID=A0ABW3K127_9BACT